MPESQASGGSELRGLLTQVRFHGDAYLIGRLADGSVVRGVLRHPELGIEYRFEGEWVQDARYGRQFAFSRCRAIYPRDTAGIRAYLMQHGAGIGPELSRRLVDAYGAETLEICKLDPARTAREVRGLTRRVSDALAEKLRGREREEEQEVALRGLLEGVRLSRAVFGRIVQRYGSEALAQVRADPFALCDAVAGIGFVTADAIAHRVGFGHEHPKRARAGVLHVLRTQASSAGHTCLRESALHTLVGEQLGVRPAIVADALSALVNEGLCVREDGWIALELYARAERDIARRLQSLAGRRPAPGRPDLVGLALDQARALESALTQGVFVLSGAPGTGKTFTIRRILDAFPDARVAVAAPTGKAAKRITEQTGAPAQTLHRLLEPAYSGGGFVFRRGARNPLEADLIVLDEVGMIDVLLMAHFLEAVPDSARVVLVGDPAQLPAVGPGNVLADLLRSGSVPSAELDQIKRQDEGWIIRNCHRIRRGQRVEVDNARARDFFVIERSHEAQIRSTVLELVTERLPRRYDVDPVRDLQVLVPLRSRTALSGQALNADLQRRLNPRARSLRPGGAIVVGDKVIQTRNNYELGIFNGDLGIVTAVDERALHVQFEAPDRNVALDVERHDLELAYALTVHKFQGSEARIVIIPVHHSAGPLILQRSWLYTAISRARDVCVIVGERAALDRAVARDQGQSRWTRLEAFLRAPREM